MIVHQYIKMKRKITKTQRGSFVDCLLKKNNRRAQIQQMESTVVLFILFFIIIMGLVFYSNVISGRVQKMGERFDDQNAKQVVQKVLSAPEIQCTSGGLVTLDCFDIQKLYKFKTQLGSSPYYQKEYGATKVVITLEEYPSLNSLNEEFPFPFCYEHILSECGTLEDSITLMDFSQAIRFKANGEEKDYESKRFNYPILLGDYRTFPERYYYGWLTIEVFSQAK